ncbi:TPA: phosphoglucosamine mutase [bacterium]|nr:phosphoglucosamine mutase [bacterium]
MKNKKLFGTDGIRGRVDVWPMTPEFILKIGKVLAHVLHKEKERRVFIAKDTRKSGDVLEAALAAGLASEGVDILLGGIIPTPGVAYLTREYKITSGVVISASHNPYQDNGLKFFGPDGFKLSDRTEKEIEEMILSRETDLPRITEGWGRIQRDREAKTLYLEFLKQTIPPSIDLRGLKVVTDCANGALSEIIPLLFDELGLEVIPIHCHPDGRNINLCCGALHPEGASEVVKEMGADIGFAFDGDGDRVIAIDEKGKIVDGDRIMAILAKSMKEKGELKGDLVITTLMSNLGLELCFRGMGISMIRTKVGDRYVLEEMQRQGAVLGGEQSGHIILLNESTTGDGTLTALKLLSTMTFSNTPLSELAKIMEPIPQILLNIKVKDKLPLEEIEKIQKAITDIENELGSEGRVLVRYSGTEPLCRIMIEGLSEERISLLAHQLAETIEKEIDHAVLGVLNETQD